LSLHQSLVIITLSFFLSFHQYIDIEVSGKYIVIDIEREELFSVFEKKLYLAILIKADIKDENQLQEFEVKRSSNHY